MEIPGKSGFWYSPESLPQNLTTEQIQTIGLGTNGTLPLPMLVELNNATLNGPDAKYIPPADKAAIASIDTFFTTARAGAVVCDTFQGPTGMTSRSWRPFNNTLGWHYTMWGRCVPGRGWASSGFDATVETTGECNDSGTVCLGVQRVKPGNPYFGSMIQSISVKVPGAVTDDQVQACCFPPNEEERNCSAVTAVVMEYQVTEDDYSSIIGSGASSYGVSHQLTLLYVILLMLFVSFQM